MHISIAFFNVYNIYIKAWSILAGGNVHMSIGKKNQRKPELV
jgi:hypothetical protein